MSDKQMLGGQLDEREATPIPIGKTHFHWAIFDALGNVIDGTKHCDVCEDESAAYERVIGSMGDQQVMKQTMRKEAYRLYDRKYPYDSVGKAVDIEAIYSLGVDPDYAGNMEADEFVAEFLDTLTPKQRETAEWSMQGYQPRDMARMSNEETSNARRYHKHIVKVKLKEFRAR